MDRVTGYLGRVKLTRKKSGRITGQPVFTSSKKKSSLGQVFFGSGQKILTRFAMSSTTFLVKCPSLCCSVGY